MSSVIVRIGWLAALLLGGCVGATFPCTTNAQCDAHEGQGRCEPSGFCSFPDMLCEPTARRYSDYAGDGLADRCTNDLASVYSGAVLADAPVGYWRLGETSGTIAADSAGAHPGTYAGGYTLGAAGALEDGNTAISLNGSTGYVSVDDPGIPAGSFSVEGWAYVTGAGSVNSNTYVALVGNTTTHNQNLMIETPTGTASGRIGAIFGTPAVFFSSNVVTLNAWHHVVYTYDGATHVQSIYTDGAANGTDTVVAAPYPSFDTAFLIGTSAMYNYWFQGSIDEVALYGAALTLDRIQAHYLAGTSPAP